MTTPKPYGLDKDSDLRWECVSLVAGCIQCETPADLIAAAELIAHYVRGDLKVGMKVAVEIEADSPTLEGSGKVIPLGRKPS